MRLPTCRLGGDCDLVSREQLLGFPGVAQCTQCSQVYETTGWAPRTCAHCLRPYGESLHDPCLGQIEGAIEACCGHGDPTRAYISFTDGRRTETLTDCNGNSYIRER